MTVRVAVPVRAARLRVWVDKGNDWSAVDRLVLWALSVKPRNSKELADVAKVPARLLNGLILRLMRAGWVELATNSEGAAFRTSAAGNDALANAEALPSVPRPGSRLLSFCVEPFTLRAFGQRDLKPYRPSDIAKIRKEHDVREVLVEEAWSNLPGWKLHETAETILGDVAGDEELTQIDFNKSTFAPAYALFTVSGNEIGGLPQEAPGDLIRAIKRAAAETKRGASVRLHTPKIPTIAGASVASPPIDRNDILLTGAEHEKQLLAILKRARYRVVIHSTFLDSAAFAKLQDAFRDAADKGASIDVFWGAARDATTIKRNFEQAIEINQIIQKDPALRDRARVHMVCTRSHAKLVLADDGSIGRYVAIVGSCNWLSTGFKRIETSIVLRHSHAIADCAQDFADLILAAIPVSETVGELTKLARGLRKLSAPSGASRIRMVRGDMHDEAIRFARNNAAQRIMVGGDRLGRGAEPKTLIPLVSASKRNDVEGTIYYSRVSAPVSKADATALKRETEATRVRLIEVPDGELHGKFLLWDDDNIIMTSLNWSSADTRRDTPYAEIGVHLTGPGLAKDISARLEQLFQRAQHERRDHNSGAGRRRRRAKRSRRDQNTAERK
jgi:phosphatidylserine/phosphatidylglycerophosphate/cardiolipin synthase-like enzyme